MQLSDAKAVVELMKADHFSCHRTIDGTGHRQAVKSTRNVQVFFFKKRYPSARRTKVHALRINLSVISLVITDMLFVL
jgi:hypothetical protein